METMHFTDVVLMLERDGTQRHPLIVDDVFATFLLLAYCKLLFVSIYLLPGKNMYNADSTSYILLASGCHCALFQ